MTHESESSQPEKSESSTTLAMDHNSVSVEEIEIKLCSHIHQSLPFNKYSVFFVVDNFRIEGVNFVKEKLT